MTNRKDPSKSSISNQQELTKQCLYVHQLLRDRIVRLRQLKDNDLCYLISTKWLQQWKEYVGYDSLIQEQSKSHKENKLSKRNPGKINADIICTPIQKRNYYAIPQELEQYQYLNEHINDKKIKDQDFIPITWQIWQAFSKHYDGYQIRRPFSQINGIGFYDGTPLKCEMVLVDLQEEEFQQKLKKTNKKGYSLMFQKLKMCLTTQWTLKQLLDFLQKYCLVVYSKNTVKIWRGFGYLTTQQIVQSMVESVKKESYLIKGREIKQQIYKDHAISSYLKSSHSLIIELTDKLQPADHDAQMKGYCEQCVQKKQLTISCVCNQVIYCSRKCRTNDQTFHYQICEKAFDSEDDEQCSKLIIEQVPIIGFDNLGNTCYMNSVIQSIISINHIRSFLTNNDYLQHLNQMEVKENNCMFLHKFSKTIKTLIIPEDSYSPWPLKGQIDYHISLFRGDKQQDANDFLLNFLNTLNDHLKKSQEKPYHSILQPFVGQFHSKVQCPHCKNISQNNQIFIQISLPIKSKVQQKIYQYTVVESLNSIRKGKSRVSQTWKQMKKDVNVVKGLIGICKEPMGLVLINQQEENPQIIMGKVKGDIIFYKDFIIPQGQYAFIFSLITMKTIVGNKMKASYGVPIILTVFDQQKTLGTFWLQIIKAFFSTNPQIVSQAESLQRQYFIQIQNSIIQETKIALQNKTLETHIAEDKQSQSCNKIAENFNKRLKTLTDKIGIQVYIHDYKRNRGLCKFCNKRCTNCELPKIFDKGFDDYFADKYFEVKFQVFLRDSLQIEYQNQEKHANGDPSIYDCLTLFSQPEELDEQNAYYCQKCDSMGLALKQLQVKVFPSILVLHLNRFKTVQGKKVKNSDSIQYGQTQNFGNRQYTLISSIIHQGSIENGHYWCISLRNGQYYIFNDSKVTKTTNVYQKNAYILIYQLK